MEFSLIELVRAHPVAEPKRQGFDYDLSDLQRELRDAGATPSRSNIYRAIAKMEIGKNERGYYSAPSVAAIMGWYTSPNKYSSFSQYVDVAGQSLYDSVSKHYQNLGAA